MLEDNTGRLASEAAAENKTSEQEYKVGPGRPPKEYQFKKGQSGNPKGRKRKSPSLAPDLKAALEQALNKKIKLKQGDRERTVTMAVAAIEQLVAQAAKGDRHARRDLFAYAEKLGVDLIAGHQQAIQQALAPNLEAIVLNNARRLYDKVISAAPVFAPPELLDDDAQDPDQDSKKD
jgi:hypothetical protein